VIYLIVNIESGGGNALEAYNLTKDYFRLNGIEYKDYVTHSKHDATSYASIISRLNGIKKIVVIGGDGTINEVLNGITDFEHVWLGILPVGSGNDFARGMGLPTDFDSALVRLVKEPVVRKVDLGVVSVGGRSRIFGISSGIGLDAKVCREADESILKPVLNKLRLGKYVYSILTIFELAKLKRIKARIRFDSKDKDYVKRLIFLAAMNLSYEGGGVMMSPNKRPDSGELSMAMAHDMSKLEALLSFPSMLKGRPDDIKGFTLKSFDKLEVITNRPVVVHADGEYLGNFDRVTFKSLPGILNIM